MISFSPADCEALTPQPYIHPSLCSMSGIPLAGNKLVKYAYFDESGISVNERVLVVAGVIIDADSQWRSVSEHLEKLVREFVPPNRQGNFVFHGKDLFHKTGDIEAARSHEALMAILKMPSQFGLAISYGFFRKFRVRELPMDASQKMKRHRATQDAQIHHSLTFAFCAVGVERFMREDTPKDEVATLIAENNTVTQRHVKLAFNAMKGRNLSAPDECRIYDFISIEAARHLPIRRITDVPHMVSKHESSLLQIADACAMTIRYCLEGRSDANAFIDALSLNQPERIHDDGQFLDEEFPGGYNLLTYR